LTKGQDKVIVRAQKGLTGRRGLSMVFGNSCSHGWSEPQALIGINAPKFNDMFERSWPMH
jgi:hypothetical protein